MLPALTAWMLALAGCADPAQDPDSEQRRSSGATTISTLIDADGDGELEPGPPEPLRPRREFGFPPAPGKTLATFAQITDLHVRDEESPARVPFLDRFGRPFTSAFRPHEALSPHVATAAVRSLNRERPQAVVITGDLLDSAQSNELDTARAVLDGGRVNPDSGRGGYDGVQEPSNPDPLYYRPDNDAPRHPGILDAAQRPYHSPGLTAPWFPVLGNHDLLVQGEVPPDPGLEEAARGTRAVVSLDPSAPLPTADPRAAVSALLEGRIPARDMRVPRDGRRRYLRPGEIVRRLARDGRAERLDYTTDIGPHVRAVMLDVVDRGGGSRGVVAPEQVSWLREQLASAGSRWVFVFSHQPLETSAGGNAALAALDEFPRVGAAISGHRHRNGIRPRRTRQGGYWLIETSSLAEFPQQSRIFRLRAAGKGAVLETWMVDHDGAGLAGVARELAFLDVQGGRPQKFGGRPGDRNARLLLSGGRPNPGGRPRAER